MKLDVIFVSVDSVKCFRCKRPSAQSNSARNLDPEELPKRDGKGVNTTARQVVTLLTKLLQNGKSRTVHSGVKMDNVVPAIVFKLIKDRSNLKNIIKSCLGCGSKVDINNKVKIFFLL